MGLNRDINALEPEARDKAIKLLDALKAEGIPVMVNETRRSQAVQNAYYKQGRAPLIDVNAARVAVGLWTISNEENRNPITYTLNSKHILGKAIDIVPLQNGKSWWNAPKEVWERIGLIGESVGFIWGGRFTNASGKPFPDSPHFEVQ